MRNMLGMCFFFCSPFCMRTPVGHVLFLYMLGIVILKSGHAIYKIKGKIQKQDVFFSHFV